jgi:hypothetical protein
LPPALVALVGLAGERANLGRIEIKPEGDGLVAPRFGKLNCIGASTKTLTLVTPSDIWDEPLRGTGQTMTADLHGKGAPSKGGLCDVLGRC